MSLTIVEALKKKGSTGGNNIMEAINNLPSGSGGGSKEYLVNLINPPFPESPYLDKTFDEIFNAILSGLEPVIIVLSDTDYGIDYKKYYCTYAYKVKAGSDLDHIAFSCRYNYIDKSTEYNVYNAVETVILLPDGTLLFADSMTEMEYS